MNITTNTTTTNSSGSDIFITLLTPTYNRAHLLPALYESLLLQKRNDIEWIIVDDGSTDDTETVCQNFIDEHRLCIRYLKQENGGKHRAINHGILQSRGTLLFICDSDDTLPLGALELVERAFALIADRPDFCGIAGLDQTPEGEIIGSGLPCSRLECNALDVRYRYGVQGDLREVYLTSILRQFPFPEIKGEKFCPEALVWNRIAKQYKLLYFNRPIYTVTYLTDGLTHRITQARMESPVATTTCYAETANAPIPFIYRVRAAINYYRFLPCLHHGQRAPHLNSHFLPLKPIGYLFHLLDKIKSVRKTQILKS